MLLGTVSAVALASSAASQAGQLPITAFQTYDPAAAAGIQPGPFSLFEVPVGSLHPTQLNEGFTEVDKKVTGFDLLAPSQLQSNLLTDIEPVVIGPGGQLYLTDGHHTFTALLNSVYGASDPTVFVNVIANYSNLTMSQFFQTMQSQNLLLPLNDGVPETVNPATGAPFPTSLTGLTSDPYRGLEYSILKNKSSKLFTSPANITGAAGASTPGLDKMTGFYSDFLEAAAYRSANNGLGLPTLSPGDIAIATKWNLTASSTTTLPNVPGIVTAAQLPGFILSNNISLNGVISNATLAGGALAGNGTFTGITTNNAGTAAAPIIIGTPNIGFVMQLGSDAGNSVTLSGANTYTGGTSILAGNLIIAGDSSLGAAVPAGATVDPNNVRGSVQAANGIIFNSLTEGNGTLTIGTTPGNGVATPFSTARPIAVGGEAATINLNGYFTTLTGQLVSLGTDGVGLGNATGESDLTIDDNASNKGVLTLSTASPFFYGNIIIGNKNAPTVRVMNDAALGNTTGAPASIGEVELNGGTLQAGASFAAPERNLFLGGGSSFDVDGFNTSWGNLTDVQRTLTVLNSNATTVGAVTFASLNISGANTTSATGATSTLALSGGTAGETVTLARGVVRTDRSTLFIAPTSAATNTTLGATEKVLSGIAPTLTNGIVAPWTIIDLGSASVSNGAAAGNNRFNFATYNATAGYGVATYTQTGAGASGGIRVATATDVVEQTGNATLAANAQAYALKLDSGAVITATGETLTLGNGTEPAGLILGGSSAAITGGTLQFNGSEAVIVVRGTTVVSSTLAGTNGLTLAGTGTLTLSSVSSGLSGVVNIDSGTLNITAANALENVSSVNLSDVKSKPSAAILTMSASNTFASLNSAGNNSSVTLTGASTVLTIGQTANANSALNNLDSTLSSTITDTAVAAGSSAIVKAGSGLLDLSGATLTLTTGSNITVDGGTLRVATSAFTNTNNIVTVAGSEVQFAQNGGGQFAGNITGGGVMHLIGGTLQLTGTGNSYTGGTIVEQGSTLDLTTANLPAANMNIANAGGLVVFDQTNTGPTFNGVISDARQMEAATGPLLSGSLVKDDSTGTSSGNLVLGAVQAYSGGTFVEAGTLTLGVANAVALSSGVDLGRVGGTTAAQIANSQGPNTATLALQADNTIQGLMSEAGNNTAVLLGANTLTINTAATNIFSFGGAISGTGSLVKDGAGLEILTGASSYTGTTTVNAGMLGVNGSIASSSLTTVNSGATLGGTGIVGNTIINGGTLAPGDAIGTLTVQGNLVFTAAASYMVEVSTAAADRTNVSGTAALAGTVLAIPLGTYNFGNAYTILHANGGLIGQFATIATATPLIATALSYTTNDALLTLSPNLVPFAGSAINQQNVAATLQAALRIGDPGAFGALFNLPVAALPGALTQLSGETATASQQTTIDAMTQFMGVMTDPFLDGRGTASSAAFGAASFSEEGDAANATASGGRLRSGSERDAQAMITKAPPRDLAFDPRWNVWAAAFGGSQSTEGNASLGSNSTTSSLGGVAVGADYRFSPQTIAGFAFAGGGTSFSVANAGTGRSDLFQAGAFVRHTEGAAYISAALAYGWQDITTNRTITVSGVEQLSAGFNANAFSGRLEGGYRFVSPWIGGIGITPYVAGQFTTIDLPGYAEQAGSGSNAFALNYAAKTVTDPRSELGFRTDRSWEQLNGVLTLRSGLAWAHDFNTDRSVMATFQTLPGASFVVNGAALSHDAALTTASAGLKWSNGFSVSATFDGEFSDVTRSYAGKAVARYQW
jgi:autotransporter-associated beta strand protein